MARLFESLDQVDTAVCLYERALARDLPAELRQRAVQRLSFVQKRRDNWPAALDLWREAAREGEIYAHVELAKYYEHRLYDCQEAARWTESALLRVAAPDYPHASRERWLEDLQHRLARVRRRANGAPLPDPPLPTLPWRSVERGLALYHAKLALQSLLRIGPDPHLESARLDDVLQIRAVKAELAHRHLKAHPPGLARPAGRPAESP